MTHVKKLKTLQQMPLKNKKILVAAKDKPLKKQLENLLSTYDCKATWLSTLPRVLKFFEIETYDLLIISSEVCAREPLDFEDFLTIIASGSPTTQLLLVAKEKDLAFAVDILESNGFEYVRHPASDEELDMVITTLMEKQLEAGSNRLLRSDETVYRFEQFIGGSPQMQKVYKQIEQVAPTNIPVLITGETGTGKELAAQSIHRLSAKRDNVYAPVNLGALPSELVASELFGHEKGSFTGASQQHRGIFERASEGTVFLDEIDSVGGKVQISLLRLIEDKKFTRLGGKQSKQTDARIIASSNENLEELIKYGKFREDLYYRLDVFRIVLPPLRDRISDIPLIAEEMLTLFNRELGKRIIRIRPDCMTALENYDWPGNVRELKNVIQSAVLLCDDEEIGMEHLPERMQKETTPQSKLVFNVGITLNEAEKQIILKTLKHTGNNRVKASELLGITRRALYNKLNKHDIN